MDQAERDLLLKAKSGDSQSMEALILKYMWLARSIARKYFLTSGTYDDLLQEGLMGIFKAVRDFDPEKNDNLTAFMSMCIGRQITDIVRSSSRAKHRFLNDAVSIDDVDHKLPDEYIYDPVHNYIEREGVEQFYKKMENLFKPHQVEVLKYYLEGYTYTEIAEFTGLPIKKVDNTLHTIKTKVKKNQELFSQC